jgi:mRNA-degrading endonuclease RelE of RelBE toxin-antitoxin system
MSKERNQPPARPRVAEVGGDGSELQSAFELRYTLDASRDIKDLDGSVRKKLRKVLEKKLAVDPEGYGLPLRGLLANYWKHEFATHRVIYRIYAEHRTVAVCAVGPRKRGDAEDIYKQLEAVVQSGRLAAQVAAVLGNILPTKK